MTYNYEQYIAYICPACSKISKEKVNIFNFSGSQAIELCCSEDDCYESTVVIHPGKDKYKISVECALCGETHVFKISKTAFWNRDIITFSCHEASAIEILFIGKKNEVEKAVHSFISAPTDYEHLLFGLANQLNTLLYSGHIRCSCGCTDIIPTTSDNRLILACAKCEKYMSIEINEKNLKKILTTSDLII